MQDQDRDPLAVLRRTLAGNQASFSCQAITPDQVDKIIRDLKNSKASGIDNLDIYILKLTRRPLCHLSATFLTSHYSQTSFQLNGK